MKAARIIFAIAAMLAIQAADARSSTVRAQFMKLEPCPSTGQLHGACPGYQIDHVSALCAGGGDEPRNLQWLTVEEHAAKTKLDVRVCAAMRDTR